MAAPNPSMWIFPRIESVDGYIEPRIMRLSAYARANYNSKFGSIIFINGAPVPIPPQPLNPYLWATYFPADAITLDAQNNGDIIFLGDDSNVLPIDYSTKDPNAAVIRTATLEVHFNDKNGFSGKDGNGNLIPYQQLFNEGSTLAQHIFNDKTDTCNYIYWETLYDANGNFLKVTFTGDISKDTMPDQTLLLRNGTENPSQQLRTATIQLHCTPVYDRITKYRMRDLIWNHFQDGNIEIRESDMDAFGGSPSHPHHKAFFAGFRVKIGDDNATGYATFAQHFSGVVGAGNQAIPDSMNIVKGITTPASGGEEGSQRFVTTESLPSWRAYNAQAIPGNPNLNHTITGCDPNSFRNGYFGISLKSILNKIAQWVGCDPSILTTVNSNIVGGSAKFNNTNNGYDTTAASSFLETNAADFITNWNILFGLDPQGCGIQGAGIATDHSIFGTKSSTTLPGAITVWCEFLSDNIYGHQSDKTFIEGQEVFIEGADDRNANGIHTITNINYTTNWQGIRQVQFDLLNTQWTKAVGSIQGTITLLFTTPITFGQNDGFDVFIKNFLWQFHCKLKFSITQSGQWIGMPVMNFTNRWQQGNTIPDTWKDGEKFNKQPRKITSDCIKVSQLGDTGYCIIPANGKLPPLEIPPLRWRTHQYGTKNGVFPPNLVFDSYNGKNLFSQSDVDYGYSSFGDNQNLGITVWGQQLSGNGWIPGSYLYENYIDALNSNPRYPSLWNNWCDVNAPFPSSDWSGFYALQSLTWGMGNGNSGFAKGNSMNPSPNEFNAMYDIARLVYLELISNREMYVRDFIGLTYLDDPDADYEMSWQEGGVLKSYRMDNRQYDRLHGRLLNSEWQASPLDENGNINYTDLSSAPDPQFYGGASSSTTSSSTGGSSSGSSSSTTTTVFNNTFSSPTRILKLYSGGLVIKTLTAMTFERGDLTNNRQVAQYSFPVEFDAQGFDTYGLNIQGMLHYKGTEFGNVEIVGLSAPGVPDYWLSGILQEKRQVGSDINVTYIPRGIIWSEDKGDWLIQNPLESASVGRTIHMAGRIQFTRDSNILHKFTNLTFKTLASGEYPFYDDICKSDSDLGIIGASRSAPSLVGNANSIDIIWGQRFKPLSVEAITRCYYENAADHTFGNFMDIQMDNNPVNNQISISVPVFPSTNVNAINMTFWLNDWAAAAGLRHMSIADSATLDGLGARYPSLLWVTTFWGEFEIVGEDSRFS